MSDALKLISNFIKTNSFLKIFVTLLLFMTLSILLRGGSQFYEGGIYISYLKSFLQDLDFNLINQIPQEMGWIISSTSYYPDFHPEVQTPFLLLLSFLEKTATSLFYFSEEYLLSALGLNFLILFISFKLSSELLFKRFSFRDKYVFLPFFLGTTLLYFCFFTSTVTDCFSIPLLLYILINYYDSKKGEPVSTLAFGIALGFFAGLKVIYAPLAVYLFFRCLFLKIPKKWLFTLGFSLPIIFKSLNTKVKFDSFFMEPHVGARVLFDYSPEHIFKKLTIGFFSQDGFFFLNPMLLIALCCCLKMLYDLYHKESKHRIDSVAFFIWLGIIFLHPIFMLGNFVEDQLPGRATLISLPLLSLGVAYIFHHSNRKNLWRAIIWSLVIWNIWVVSNFVIIDSIDVSHYYLDKFAFELIGFDTSTYLINLLNKNFSALVLALPSLITFCLFITFLLASLKIFLTSFNIKSYTLNAWVIIFGVMTVHNIIFGPVNVTKMQEEKILANKVMGNGSDLFLYDFLLDRFNSIDVESRGEMREELSRRAQIYYKRIEPQIIKSTPLFDSYIKHNKWNSSYFQSKKGQ